MVVFCVSPIRNLHSNLLIHHSTNPQSYFTFAYRRVNLISYPQDIRVQPTGVILITSGETAVDEKPNINKST